MREALGKVQNEMGTTNNQLAKAREKAIYSTLERAELWLELETVIAQLKACRASKVQLDGIISKVSQA